MIRYASLFILIASLLPSFATAQRILPGTDHPIWKKDGERVISVRPQTTARMEGVKRYMRSVEDFSSPTRSRYQHAKSKIEEWRNEIKANPFYRRDHPHDINDGVFTEVAHMVTHLAQDIWRATDDLLGKCGDIAFPNAGLCWKRKCRDAWFATFCWYEDPQPIKSYRLPIQMIELVENRGQTGYMLQPITYGASLAGEWMNKLLVTGIEEGLSDIPVIGGLLSRISEPISDVFGDVVGYDAKLTTRLMDTTAKVVGLRDHGYLYGCESLDPTDTRGIVDCIRNQFFSGYKDISDFEFRDSDNNPITEHMAKYINTQEISLDGRTETPYENFSTRYHNFSEPGDGYRYIEYHLFQPSPYHEQVITTLRNIRLFGRKIFEPIIGKCEKRLNKIVYFSEWPFALGAWDWGSGGMIHNGLPSIITGNNMIPVPTGILYSRSLGSNYMGYIIGNRGSSQEAKRMKHGLRQKLFNYKEFNDPVRLARTIGDGSHTASADPFACVRADMTWGRGKTPNDMLYPLVRGDRPGEGSGRPLRPGGLAGPNPNSVNVEPGVCQGANLGSWAPALSRTSPLHGPSASELGVVRAISMVRANPSWHINRRAYRIDVKRDKLQWLRDENMREINEGCHDFGRKAGWEYNQQQIAKDVEDEGLDDEFWNVALHWKRFRCCKHNRKRCKWDWSDSPIFPWCGSDGDLFDIRE